MKHWARVVIAVAGIAVLVCCGKESTAVSQGDTTASASTGQSVTAAEIDSLVVPIEQVPGGGLHNVDVDKQPSTSPPDAAGPDPGSPCMLIDLSPGDVVIFGHDGIAFRDVRYSGFGNVYVVQALGVYHDDAAAQAVFEKLFAGLNSCKATNPPGTTFTDLAPTEVAWQATYTSHRGSGESMNSSCGDEARVVKNVVFRTSACHYDNSAQIAAAVADKIAAKINSPG